MEKKMKDILDKAIYGTPETRPEERRIFLTTIRERIHYALTKRQVRQAGMYPELVKALKTGRNLHLFINGNLAYQSYSNYAQEASKYGIQFTIVTPTTPTPVGLVLAEESRAINKPEIFITDRLYQLDIEEGE